ncbi:MAG: hypothetical protein ABI351_07365, partial [Herbaspirillum sp.]
VSKWFARYCDGLGLSDRELTFHSFRHGAVTLLTKKNVQRELKLVIFGHSGHSSAHDIYIHMDIMFTTADKKAAIDLLDFSGVIEYVALKQIAPTLDDLNLAMKRHAKKPRNPAS